jgi:hypothetical protein
MHLSFSSVKHMAATSSPQWRVFVRMLAIGLVVGAAPALPAQVVPGTGAAIGSPAADRARLRQITGARATDDGDSLGLADGASRLRAVEPTVRIAWNSDIPFGGNDAALWAGRGTNFSVTGGVSYSRWVWNRQVDVVLSPVVTYSQNRPFPTRPGRAPGRSAFSSPWYFGVTSADLPLRFGDLPIRGVGLGQSSVTVTTGRLAFGAASDNEWWGPAIRNTLSLGNNAAGVPRLFVRTTRPHRTRFGDFEGRAFIGVLTESPFFDTDASNDHRSLSALLVLYRPSIDSGLTLGISRLVTARIQSSPAALLHSLDAALRYDAMRPVADTTDDGKSNKGSDALLSLFARWVFPQSGFEAYLEWAHNLAPSSIRELLEVPQNSQAYTAGLQWANVRPSGRALRMQAELSYLEQTRFIAGRWTQDYYTGQGAVQGFTQRGQVLGAAIGPGASEQFLALDWLDHRWQAGAFIGRTRNENDALYREGGPRLTQHDVTVYSGVRAGGRTARTDVLGTLTIGRRYNYLLQSLFYLADPVNAVDIQNTSLTITLTPR